MSFIIKHLFGSNVVQIQLYLLNRKSIAKMMQMNFHCKQEQQRQQNNQISGVH